MYAPTNYTLLFGNTSNTFIHTTLFDASNMYVHKQYSTSEFPTSVNHFTPLLLTKNIPHSQLSHFPHTYLHLHCTSRRNNPKFSNFPYTSKCQVPLIPMRQHLLHHPRCQFVRLFFLLSLNPEISNRRHINPIPTHWGTIHSRNSPLHIPPQIQTSPKRPSHQGHLRKAHIHTTSNSIHPSPPSKIFIMYEQTLQTPPTSRAACESCLIATNKDETCK